MFLRFYKILEFVHQGRILNRQYYYFIKNAHENLNLEKCSRILYLFLIELIDFIIFRPSFLKINRSRVSRIYIIFVFFIFWRIYEI